MDFAGVTLFYLSVGMFSLYTFGVQNGKNIFSYLKDPCCKMLRKNLLITSPYNYTNIIKEYFYPELRSCPIFGGSGPGSGSGSATLLLSYISGLALSLLHLIYLVIDYIW